MAKSRSEKRAGRARERVGASVVFAFAAAVVSIAGVAAALWLHRRNVGHGNVVSVLSFADVVVAVSFPPVGAFLVRRRPDNAVGWILVATSLLGVYCFAGQYAVAGLVVDPGSLPLASAAAWLAHWGWAPHLLVPTVLPQLFPYGNLPPGRWRAFTLVIIGVIPVIVVGSMFSMSPTDVSPEVENPLGLTHVLDFVVAGLAFPLFFFGTTMSMVSLVLRQRRARGRERTQLQWLLVGGISAGVGAIVSSDLSPEPWGEIVFAVGLAMVPVTILIAVVRHRLLDINVVLNRALVYALLSALLLLSYVGTVALVGQLAFGRRLALAVVALAALVAASARDRVQRLVDHILYGARRDPYTVVSRVGGRLDLATGPLEALRSLAEEVRDVLKLPYVSIVPANDELPSVASGTPVAGVEGLPVLAQGAHVGVLEVGHRHQGERFRNEEEGLLLDVARRAGTLVHAADLLASLQRSRERLVVAREEERRRLRHDLHDGLGPQLASVALQLDTLASRVQGDAELAARVGRLQEVIRRTVADVRHIVEDLRPAALDGLGLAGALRELVADLPGVRIEGAAVLPDLPAAVEVAAYRIASEAVNNAVRHAGADSCTVRLDVEPGWLVLEVRDDGRGIPPDSRAGVGLQSMQDRAAEVGGELQVATLVGSGTSVAARIPLHDPAPQEPESPPVTR